MALGALDLEPHEDAGRRRGERLGVGLVAHVRVAQHVAHGAVVLEVALGRDDLLRELVEGRVLRELVLEPVPEDHLDLVLAALGRRLAVHDVGPELGPVPGEVLLLEELVDLLPALVRVGRGEERHDLVRVRGATGDVEPGPAEPLGVLRDGGRGDLLLLDPLVDVLVDLLREGVRRLRLVRARGFLRRGRLVLRFLTASADGAQREDSSQHRNPGARADRSHRETSLNQRKSSCDGREAAKARASCRSSRRKNFVRLQDATCQAGTANPRLVWTGTAPGAGSAKCIRPYRKGLRRGSSSLRERHDPLS